MRTFGRLVFCGLFLLCAVFVTADSLLLVRAERAQSVEIENFCGVPYTEGMLPPWVDAKIEYVYDDSTPRGTVIGQSLPAGSRRKLTQRNPKVSLTLRISLGEESCVLPNVLSEDFRTAVARLRELGFSVETVHSFGAYPKGTVFASEPRAGTLLPKGSRVLLSVSDGSPSVIVEVPNVVGLSRGDAFQTLWMAGLRVQTVTERESILPFGTVTEQSIAAGTRVLSGSPVSLTVSSGDAYE